MNDMESVEKITVHKRRIEKWDLARALLIFLVVFGHIADSYVEDSARMREIFLFIYTFHIPCFLFLDGLFSKHTVNEKKYSHIFSYLIMYLFSKILISLTRGIISHEFTFHLLSEDGLPWYGLALFWFSLVTIFLRKFPKKWVFISSIVLACFVGYDSTIHYSLAIMRSIVFYPFFFAGYCLEPSVLAEKLSRKWVKMCAGGIIIIFAIICFRWGDQFYFLRTLITGTNSYKTFASAYNREDLIYFGGLMRLCYYAVVFLIGASVITLIPNHIPHSGFLSAIGRRSLQIYILHRPVIYILYEGFKFDVFSHNAGISNYIIIPIAIGITVFFALPFWEKPIRTIVYPNYKIEVLDKGR